MATKKLKIFGVPWHTAHQYSLAQMPFVDTYDMLIEPYRKGFATSQRPLPEKIHYVDHFEKGKYDYAILHVDQQCIYSPEDGDKISKGRLYMEVNQLIHEKDPDLPVIVINHMTPFHDKYESDVVVSKIKKLVGDNHMIVNSHVAREQWGWGHTITHGMDANDWLDLPKEPRCTVVLSPAGMEKAYRRVFILEVQRRLSAMGVDMQWVGVNKKFNDFNSYREFLGRSLVFFMGTWQSPMPRARTEAMLSGCCVVTTPYHDADTFIKHGENGFLTSKESIKDPRIMDNPDTTAELIRSLIQDTPELAIKIGQEGKKTAQEIFSKERFDTQWEKYLKSLGIL